ncbi:FCD domain-containing protein [Gilliamella sp. Pra-s65]|uniref:GntR family transcriptional regulator n=1 Tax=unclassified Gilliamella TaxID=2685620 RepID=UPI0013657FCA|nr:MULTISPECIES: GntR family transcriptional regulator [unclassified Gilliamella]MWN89760.1 FCD domain-containing protein [Gilliamella sp. Pra-s65]MWP47285.1 FCD domain-containing protein [Gilliamella sp. Pas-s27]MWP72768.1 FCD domain-containing protein [Gilliamella sp. Pra-s52]
MGRSQTLRQNTINQFIDCINNNILSFPLPSISILADAFNVSRTTIRAVLEYLCRTEILLFSNNEYHLLREPTNEDKIACIFEKRSIQDKKFETYFYDLINHKKLLPGDNFNEIQLAKETKVNPIVVREFLLRFLHYGLINNIKKGEWELVTFAKDYAEKLYEFRSVLEIFALKAFMSQPDNHINWIKARELLQRHKNFQQKIQNEYTHFSTLDRDFHQLILSCNDNPFFMQSFDLISVIFHFHYQWDNSDLKERNSIAVSEHIAVLTAILQKNEHNAIEALCRHLNTAKTSMQESIGRTLTIKNR